MYIKVEWVLKMGVAKYSSVSYPQQNILSDTCYVNTHSSWFHKMHCAITNHIELHTCEYSTV